MNTWIGMDRVQVTKGILPILPHQFTVQDHCPAQPASRRTIRAHPLQIFVVPLDLVDRHSHSPKLALFQTLLTTTNPCPQSGTHHFFQLIAQPPTATSIATYAPWALHHQTTPSDTLPHWSHRCFCQAEDLILGKLQTLVRC